MKKLLPLLICLTTIIACNNQNRANKEKRKEEICINIHYKQKVNGYDVSVKIITDSLHEEYFSDIVSRRAILCFKKESQELIIQNPSYADNNLIGNINLMKNGAFVESDYLPFEKGKNNTFNGNKSPFFFFDVDFDGEQELVVCLWEEMGYRGHHAYEAYKINTNNNSCRLSPMRGEPFNELDDYTEFDATKQTISIPYDVGLKIGGLKVYGLIDGTFALIERVQYDWEHTEGVKYELCEPTIYYFKIVNGIEKLDRIERCPNDKQE